MIDICNLCAKYVLVCLNVSGKSQYTAAVIKFDTFLKFRNYETGTPLLSDAQPNFATHRNL